MSKIAQALAKATESTGHTTAPFLTGLPPSEPPGRETKEAELRKARLRWRFWRWLAFIAFPLTALILWLQFGDARRKPAGGVKPDTKVEVASTTVKSTVPVSAAEAEAPESSSVTRSRAELQAQLQAMVFTALMPGARPRIVHQGRVIGTGDHVNEEFTFTGVEDGLLMFKDSTGAVYSRRY
jgi:hypothetical protein